MEKKCVKLLYSSPLTNQFEITNFLKHLSQERDQYDQRNFFFVEFLPLKVTFFMYYKTVETTVRKLRCNQ